MVHKPHRFMSDDVTTKWRRHLVDYALPFWHRQGFDHKCHLYHERLGWKGEPVSPPQLRLMVQARQIATYCRAQLDGLYKEGAEQALETLGLVERLYYQADGAPGWVFSLAPEGHVVNGLRDLYAHAFILFAYGWAYHLTQDRHYLCLARETTTVIDKIFALNNGGFASHVPSRNEERSQNPHMHLLEAYLVLCEVTHDEFYLDHAVDIVTLANRHFIDHHSGILYEFMDKEWQPRNIWGENRIEPGHLFEWSWLFNEYRRLAGLSSAEDKELQKTGDHLFQTGRSKGCDRQTGLAFDAINENGIVLEHSTRIWPQTELIRRQNQLLSQAGDAEKKQFQRLNSRFLDHYMPLSLKGGWVDQYDENQKAKVDYMPASSLYHIYGAGREMVVSL